jgi:7 transmembrane receptor (rhodopsin family).
MMMLKQVMVLVVLQQATTYNKINNTSEVLEQVAVSKAIKNTSDVFQQAVVGKDINIKTDVLEQATTVKAMNNTSNALEEVSFGKAINNTNDVCSLFNINQFKDKTCANLVNSTYIVNIKNVNIVTKVCSKLAKNYAVNIKNNPIALCEEVNDCLHVITTTSTACSDILRRVLPDQADYDKFVQEYTALLNTLTSIQYTFFGIFLLVGIAMNGLLIVIFIRHKNARTDPILINIAVVDSINLAVIMPTKILLQEYEIPLQILHLNEVFIVCSIASNFVLEYSLVTISYQRFRAVFSKIEIQNEKRMSNFIKTTVLWLLGLIYGALCLVSVKEIYSRGGVPSDTLDTINLYTPIFIEGIIPGILVTVFSLLASRKLKKLAENFPGERSHHLQRIQDRYLAAKTLIVLIVLFLVTYMPQKIILTVIMRRYLNSSNKAFHEFARDQKQLQIIKCLSSIMDHINSVLNPVFLYFLSSKFRRYFNSYLHCRSRELD